MSAAAPSAALPGDNRPLATMLALHRDPLGFLEKTAARYGDFAQLRVGPYRLFFGNHPELVHEVLVTKHASFAKGRILDQARDIFGQGLLTSEGDLHRRQRRLIQPAFHRRRIEAYAGAMAADAAAAAARWRDGETVDAAREMTRLTLRIVARTASPGPTTYRASSSPARFSPRPCASIRRPGPSPGAWSSRS